MSEVRFGAYRIEEPLDSGALSTVYKAVQEPLGRVVALKALNTQIAPTSPFGEQLDREAKILSDLAHPNVALLLEASRSSSGRPYLVLEYVDGPTLEAVLRGSDTPTSHGRDAKRKKRRRLDVPTALAIALGLGAALEHVHERGIVHRDVKPSNVLLSRTGVVKLIDFGIAQRPRMVSMSDSLGAEGITASGRMAPEPIKDALGTPAYMSPEQILGDFVDGRSDLFSLGVILYQMLSGSRPFEPTDGDDKRSASARLRRDTPAPLRERAPHCPRAVERIVMRLLEKSPNDRYASASIVKERLEAALRAETRDDAASLIRTELSANGFGQPTGAPGDRSGARESTSRRERPKTHGATRAPIGVRRAFVGYGVVTTLFAIGAVVNEGTGARARENRSAGAQALELVPKRAGGLRVVATPWAHVHVDGQLVDTTPFARAIPLYEGKHFVTLTHPDSPTSIEREVTIVAGENVTLDVTLNVSLEDAGRDAP